MKLSVLLERPLTRREARKAEARYGSEALVGFEFEFAVPEGSKHHAGDGTASSMELRSFSDLGDITNYFDTSVRMRYRIDADYEEWIEKQKQDWIDDNWELYADDDEEDEDAREEQAREQAESLVKDKIDLSVEAYVDDEHGSWYNFVHNYSLEPSFGWEEDRGNDRSSIYTEERMGGQDNTRSSIADALAEYLGRHVSAHDAPGYKHWKVVPDGSIQGGHDAEIVSPPMPWHEGKDVLQSIANFAELHELTTNHTTGLHVNISVPGIKDIDLVKFVLFLGDEFALEVFDRSNNDFAKSQSSRIVLAMAEFVKQNNLSAALNSPGFEELQRIAKAGLSTHKYNTVNIGKLLDGYLEIRIAGGNYLDKMRDLMRFLDRIIIALDTAMDPQSDRQLYMKKLVALFNRGKWHANPVMPSNYLITLVKDRHAVEALKALMTSTEMHVGDAYTLMMRVVSDLADETRRRGLKRLTFAQAGELFKLLKKFGLSMTGLIAVGGNPIKADLQLLGLSK